MEINTYFNNETTILIVDDNTKNLQIVGSILREHNYRVAAAKDGANAIKIVNKIRPDLILLDIMMPGMDGFQVCTKIKNNEKTKNIPIIFLTAKTDSVDIVKGLTAGGVDYITKPFIKEELLARIRNQLMVKFSEEHLTNLIKSRDKFFSIIAHDLKNPITTLLSLTEILNNKFEDYNEERKKKLIGAINESANIQYKLLENLLSWARLQTGNMRIQRENFNMNELINEVISTSKSTARAKKIEIIYREDDEILVDADKNMIATVVRNLLSNAIKFSFNNSKITVTTASNDDNVIVSVIDEGMGMVKEKIDKTFTMSSNSTPGTNDEKGTGLGLLLCKEFVEKNDGEIWIESEEKKGTKVFFTLPRA